MNKDVSVKQLTAADFPPAVRPFWSNIEGNQIQKLALTLAAIVCYCGLSPRLRVKYVYDNFLSMLLVNLLCIGDSGCGKKPVQWVVNRLMNSLIEQDEKARNILREHREKNRSKANNAKKEPEPLVAIRFLQKFTLPVVVKYADVTHRLYGDWLPFFLYADEMGAFIENRSKSAEYQSVARTAYSLGETYTRDTLYQDGYNARVDINWNSVICGQEYSLAKYIDKQGVVLGDAGRQILVKLGESIGEDALTVSPFSEQQEKDINGAIDKLMAETFTADDQLVPIREVNMHWLDKDVRLWCEQQREIILKSGSRAHDSFYVRASVSAFRLVTMLYHLWNEKEGKRKEVRRCYYYFAQFILDGLMAQWGQVYEAAMPKERECTTARLTLYDSMPKRFSKEQLREAIVKGGLSTPARVFVHKWMGRKWIFEVENEVYEKLY